MAHRKDDAAAVTIDETAYVIGSPVIRKVNFTGSTGVGRMIAEMACRNLKPVLLELGGEGAGGSV